LIPKVPKITLTEEEGKALQAIRAKIANDYNSKNQDGLWATVKAFFAWGFMRYKLQPPFPEIGMVQESLRNLSGQESMGGFTLENGIKPVFYIALFHSTHLQDPAQLPMSIFHEIHHYIDWKKDPANYEKQKGLPPTHPIEVQHEIAAIGDLTAFLREWANNQTKPNR
jgi:hypothetical protein